MVEIGSGFLGTGQAIIFCRGAAAQVAVLRQDEPDPVAALAAREQLSQRSLVYATALCIDEPLKVEGIARGGIRRGPVSPY